VSVRLGVLTNVVLCCVLREVILTAQVALAHPLKPIPLLPAHRFFCCCCRCCFRRSYPRH
jgi:hypothetical protein